MPQSALELPYEGAKAMLVIDEVDDRAALASLFNALYDDLPAPKPKKQTVQRKDF